MLDRILFIAPGMVLDDFLSQSLTAEGYEVTTFPSFLEARERLGALQPHLILVNGLRQGEKWLAQAAESSWPVPTIILMDAERDKVEEDNWLSLIAPFAFQDLLLLIQNTLHQRTLVGQRPFELTPKIIDRIDNVLKVLREDLRARCVVLSSSSGRLIKTVGAIESNVAISLAALMSGSFSASAKAAQLLGQGDIFDSNLQESEGYGIYAILLHDKLILTIAFSDKITIGMVRHYAAQAAIDILEVLVQESKENDLVEELNLSADFRQTVTDTLGEILGD